MQKADSDRRGGFLHSEFCILNYTESARSESAPWQ